MDDEVSKALKIICQSLEKHNADEITGYVIDIKHKQAFQVSVKKVKTSEVTDNTEDKATETEKQQLIRSILKDFPEESK